MRNHSIQKALNPKNLFTALAPMIIAIVALSLGNQKIAMADNTQACAATFSEGSLELSWGDGGGTHVVQQDGSWIATVGQNIADFTVSDPGPDATYSIRTWVGASFIDRTCEYTNEPSPVVEQQCVLYRDGSETTLSWNDNGSRFVVRKNEAWLATPGENVSNYIDSQSTPEDSYELRAWKDSIRTDTLCIEDDNQADIPPQVSCTLVHDDLGQTILSWNDLGGNHVIIRNSNWLATVGENASTYTDTNGSVFFEYILRIWEAGTRTDHPCVDQTPTNPDDDQELPESIAEADRTIHVSIDGLRSDHVNETLTPNLHQLILDGSSTLNARTDPSFTQTLPNHHSQFTGRNVYGIDGHQIDYNNAIIGVTVHHEAGSYIASVFDVVHDNGGDTILIAGKSKFDMFERNWNLNGALDVTGEDNGTQKISFYDRDNPQDAVPAFIDFFSTTTAPAHGFYHIRTPDSGGHTSGWGTVEYAESVTEADRILGELLTALDGTGLRDTTTVIVTSDHGGPTDGFLHSDATDPSNFTVPLIIEGPGVTPGSDLYSQNVDDRFDPGDTQIQLGGSAQPIRTGETANIVLDLLGLPSVPGSTLNSNQSLDF